MHVQLFCRFCGDPVNERDLSPSGVASNVPLESQTTPSGATEMGTHKVSDPGRSLWCTHCAAYGIVCCICQQSVRGAAFLCSACGHGGHVTEIAAWFRGQAECPSGCGCRCAELLHASDFDQSFETEDFKAEFRRSRRLFVPVDSPQLE